MYSKYLHIFFGQRTGPPIEEISRGEGLKALCCLEK